MKYALFIGEMLIDFIPRPGAAGEMPSYYPHPGGAVANAAVALARLGGAARFVGKLSQDAFGRLLWQTLEENGVDTRFIPTTNRANTTLALVTLQADGQREFSFYRQGTADTLLEARDLDASLWEHASLCHAGSVLLAGEPARSATLAALAEARRRNLPVTFDVNARPALWSTEEELRALLAEIVARVDLLKFSAEEAHYLAGTSGTPFDPADLTGLQALGERLLTRGPALVVITRGPLGVLLLNRRQSVVVPASPIQAVDTTGAGDACMGALLYHLLTRDLTTPARLAALESEELRALGVFANTAAGLSCTRSGGIASLPRLTEMEQL